MNHFMAPRLHDRRFCEMFRCSSIVFANAWLLIIDVFNHDMPSGATKVRFLWALNLFKAYDTEGNLSENVGEGCNEKTFRYWAWYFIKILSERWVEIVRLVAFVSCFLLFVTTQNKKFLHHSCDRLLSLFPFINKDRFWKLQDKQYWKWLSCFCWQYQFCSCLGCESKPLSCYKFKGKPGLRHCSDQQSTLFRII